MSLEAQTPPGSAFCPASPLLCLGFSCSADTLLPFSWDMGPKQGQGQPGGEGVSARPPDFSVGDGMRACIVVMGTHLLSGEGLVSSGDGTLFSRFF